MSLCINPTCTAPNNSDDDLFCQACGSELLLCGQYRVSQLLEKKEGLQQIYEVSENNVPLILKVFPQDSLLAHTLFQQEVYALKNLNYPGIPDYEYDFTYYSYQSSVPLDCVVMEKIQGMNLQQYQLQRRNRPVDPKFAFKWMQQLVAILHSIHSQQFAHYNIKPSNILLKPDGQLALLNFSKARPFTDKVQRQTELDPLLTPGFTAPEQEKGFAIPKSDFYALGRTFVYLLTGKSPLDPEIYDFNRDELNWRSQCLTLPPEFGDFIDHLMKRSPQQRPEHTTAILQELDDLALTILSSKSLRRGRKGQSSESVPTSSPVVQLLAPPQEKTLHFETVTLSIQASGFLGLKKEAQYHRQPQQTQEMIFDLGNQIFLSLVQIPGDSFLMGSAKSELGHYSREEPQHQVDVPSFYMGKYTITQGQWEQVMDYNPSHFKGKNRPVERVSWEEAMEFTQKLSALTGQTFQLPSEAQWEYACHGKMTTPFCYGETITPELVNYDGNYIYGNAPKGEYRRQTVTVGSFPPNAFGLYEIHGNVWEWCLDSWHETYNNAPSDARPWLEENGDKKILRGGSWNLNPHYCRRAFRYWYVSSFRWNNIGLRIVCNGLK